MTDIEHLRTELKRDLHAYIRRPDHPHGPSFEALAERVIVYQRQALPAYGRLCKGDHLGWHEAPLVPTELFRELDLCSLPMSPSDRTFLTSGTTEGRRGQRRVPDLSLYDAAMAAPFIAHVLGGDTRPHRWVSLIPRADVLPESSLSHMVTALSEPLSSECFWVMDKEGLDLDLALRALSEGNGFGDEPVIVLTTAFAIDEFLEGARWLAPLPKGSRLMLTGGFKGRREAIPETELISKIEQKLGIARDHIIGEYGMTELSSQAYGIAGLAMKPNPGLRFRILHPDTGKPLLPGQVGLVACFDLLNLDNVSAVLTGDLGAIDTSGALTLYGRRPGAIPRGCSLTAEELLRGS